MSLPKVLCELRCNVLKRGCGMIFVTDAEGYRVHASKEWTALTGQKISASLGKGWLDRVHANDRQLVIDTLETSIEATGQYNVRYRLLMADGTSCWVSAGGVPAFGIDDNRFIGYLGTITKLAVSATDTIAANGQAGRFAPPVSHPTTIPNSDLELIADHLILAHSMMEGGGYEDALSDLQRALFKIGRSIAARSQEHGCSLH